MAAGPKRHRVEVQTFTEGRDSDGDGGVTATWATAATRWASVRALSGRERLQAAAQEGETTHEVGLRWYDGLKGRYRFRWGSRYFYPVGPPVSARNVGGEDLKVLCVEREG